jgi:hypothetical protein
MFGLTAYFWDKRFIEIEIFRVFDLNLVEFIWKLLDVVWPTMVGSSYSYPYKYRAGIH